MMLQMLDMLRKMQSPETTIGEFVATLERMVAHAECRYCHQPISRAQVSEDQDWFHDDSGRMRGCRAASYGEDGWNEKLDRKWRATPETE